MAKKSSPKPAVAPDAHRVRTTFYIDKPALAALQERNRQTGVPVAYMMRQAIDEYIVRALQNDASGTAKTAGPADELKGR